MPDGPRKKSKQDGQQRKPVARRQAPGASKKAPQGKPRQAAAGTGRKMKAPTSKVSARGKRPSTTRPGGQRNLKKRNPASSLDVKMKKRSGNTSMQVGNVSSPASSGRIPAMAGHAPRRRPSEAPKPGLFRLSVKFTIAISITIGMVLGLVGMLIYQRSRKVIDEQVNEGGVKIARALGVIHSEYYQALNAGWRVGDLVEFQVKYNEHVKDSIDEAIKRLTRETPMDKKEKDFLIDKFNEATKKLPTVDPEADPDNWVRTLTRHYPLDGSVEFESDIADILVIIPPEANNPPVQWSQVLAHKEFLWSLNKSVPITTSIDNSKWKAYKAGSGDVDVDNVFIYETFLNSKTVRAFRAPLRNRDGDMVGGVIVFIGLRKIYEHQSVMLQDVIRFSFVGIGMGIIVGILLSVVVNRPIKRLINDVEIVAQGNLDHQTIATSDDEVGVLARAFNNMTRNLKISVVEQLQAEAREKETAHELNIAQEIQAKLLPDSLPAIKGYDLEAFYRPSKDVGGDYYDFVIVDPNHLGIIVADVSGKGIPGALVMTMTRSLMRMAAPGDLSPANTMKKVNRILAKDIRRGMFVTAMYGMLNIRNRTMTLVSAGHNPAVIYRGATDSIELVNPKGMALGFDKGTIFDRTIEEETLTLNPGDRVTFYTDGVVEAMNHAHEEYTEEALIEYAKNNSKALSLDFVHGLVDELEAHRGNAPQHDDITIATFSIR